MEPIEPTEDGEMRGKRAEAAEATHEIVDDAEKDAPETAAIELNEEVFIPPTAIWRLADLVEAEYNPREITERELADLAISIDDFGLVEDVVVNVHPTRRGIVVGGHQRIKVLRARRQESIPCKEVSLSLARERELNARLNGNGGRFSGRLLVEGGYGRDELESWGLAAADLEAFDRAAEEFEAARLEAENAGGGGEGGGPPFPVLDPTATTKHRCPKCSYEWN